ncbi:CHAT domain-containing protein [Actinomadura sp. 9N215]|uniref:CHAT domain-containing protein n=1 Tax=Actinomadura sp. 9N215 TaxID=3375150 RepID=UPI003797905A
MDDQDVERRIAWLRAEIAALPPGHRRKREELNAELGILLADLYLRPHPTDQEEPRTPDPSARAPLASDALDESIAALIAAGAHREELTLVRLGALLTVRFVAFYGPVDDRETAIGALRKVMEQPGADRWDRELAGLLLGILLVLRLMPPGLRAAQPDQTPDFNAMLEMVTGFLGGGQAVSVDEVDEAAAHLGRAAECELWPSDIRALAAMLRSLMMLVRPGQQNPLKIIELMTQALQSTSAATPGKAEFAVVRLWTIIEHARNGERLDEAAEALDEARRQLDELPEGHALRGVLQRELGLSELGSFEGAEAGLAWFAQALDGMDEDHPLYDNTRKLFGGALLSAVAADPARGSEDAERVESEVARVVATAREILDRQTRASTAGADADDREARVALGRDHFLYGMALILKSVCGRPGGDTTPDADAEEDLRAGSAHLSRAMLLLPDDDELTPVVAGTFGAVLSDRHLAHGTFQHAEAAHVLLDRSERELRSRADDAKAAGTGGRSVTDDLLFLRGMAAISRAVHGWNSRDEDALATAAATLHEILDAVPDGFPMRHRFVGGLALAHAGHGLLREDTVELSLGLGYGADAAAGLTTDRTSHPGMRAVSAIAALAQGMLDSDAEAIDGAVPRLEDAAHGAVFLHGQRAHLRWALGVARMARHHAGAGRPDDLDAAIADFTAAAHLIGDEPGNAAAPDVLFGLAEALRLRGHGERAVEAGLDGLRAVADQVRLQIGAEHGLLAARSGADQARRIALWALDDGRPERAVEALELGRALVLHSATVGADVPDLLAVAGTQEAADLAERWRAQGGGADLGDAWRGAARETATAARLVAGFVGGELPVDLRRRALRTLAAQEPEEWRVPPDAAALAEGLAKTGADALVYLLHGEERGWAIVIGSGGTLTALPLPALAEANMRPLWRYAALHDSRAASETLDDAPDDETVTRWRSALEGVCDWAWPQLMEQVLAAGAESARAKSADAESADAEAARVEAARVEAADGGVEPRVVLVPCGVLGMVAWHAARHPVAGAKGRGRYRYALEYMVLSYAASGRQLLDGARPDRVRAEGAPVLVGNPDGSPRLITAGIEAAALRDRFYADGAVYGMPVRRTDGHATPETVLTALTDPGKAPRLFHCASHALSSDPPSRSALILSGRGDGRRGTLPVADILAQLGRRRFALVCELVVLSACVSDVTSRVYDEALTLCTAFRAGGARHVVGSRWWVPSAATALMMFVFHDRLVTGGLAPVDALRAAQRWMLDPERKVPAGMPVALRERLEDHRHVLDDLASWAAFTHQGPMVAPA